MDFPRAREGWSGWCWWEIRTGCGNVNVVEGDADDPARVLLRKEMSAYEV